MELREQIARKLAEQDGFDWDDVVVQGRQDSYFEDAEQLEPLIKEYYVPKEEIERLEVIGDEGIRVSCLGRGMYFAGEMDDSATADPEIWMPKFRNVAQAQLQDIKKKLLGRIK